MIRTDPRLIAAAISASGLHPKRFAVGIMGRHERTIQRWVAGDVRIPPAARAFLVRWLELTEAQRTAMVRWLVG